MNAAVGLMDGLGLDSDRYIRVIPRHKVHMACKVVGKKSGLYVNEVVQFH